jgi:hypothetical protein
VNDDPQLLHRYAEEGSEPAFSELVARHIDLVYSYPAGEPDRRSGAAGYFNAGLFSIVPSGQQNLRPLNADKTAPVFQQYDLWVMDQARQNGV